VLKGIHDSLSEIQDPETVCKSGMLCAWVGEAAYAELANPAEALKLPIGSRITFPPGPIFLADFGIEVAADSILRLH